MKIKFTDILPNPNRDLIFNPCDPVKVEALVASINETGFWDNVVVRKSPTKKGKYEQAYGHNRLAAARKAGLTQADFIIKDFDDEQMIKVMGKDNDEAFAYSILSLLEKVKAVVIGLAERRVRPFKIADTTKDSSVIYAPSYMPGVSSSSELDHRYTVPLVAQFLGMYSVRKEDKAIVPHNSVITAIKTLHLMQHGSLTEESVKDRTIEELSRVVREMLSRSEVTKEREQQKAQREAERRKSEMQRAAEAKAEQKKAQAAIDKLIRHGAAEYSRKMQAQREQELADAKERKRIADERVAEAKKDWDDGEAQRKRDKDEREKQQAKEAARRAAQHSSHVKAIVDAASLPLTRADSLYERLRALRKTAVTPQERSALVTALTDTAARFREEAAKWKS